MLEVKKKLLSGVCFCAVMYIAGVAHIGERWCKFAQWTVWDCICIDISDPDFLLEGLAGCR